MGAVIQKSPRSVGYGADSVGGVGRHRRDDNDPRRATRVSTMYAASARRALHGYPMGRAATSANTADQWSRSAAVPMNSPR